MSRYSLIVKKQTKNGRFSPDFTSRAPAFEDRCKPKADGFPNLTTWREPDLSRQKDSVRIGLESPSVEKYVNNRLKKSTGVHFLTFRTGYLHLKTASK
jgi:hypothetical protein